jgi:hypothetical protein
LGRWRSYRRIGVRLFAAWMRARKFVADVICSTDLLIPPEP